MLGISIGAFVLGWLEVSLLSIAAENQGERIRRAYFHHVLRQEISWFDKNNPNELVTRIVSDTTKIHNALGPKLGVFIRFTSTFVSGNVHLIN